MGASKELCLMLEDLGRIAEAEAPKCARLANIHETARTMALTEDHAGLLTLRTTHMGATGEKETRVHIHLVAEAHADLVVGLPANPAAVEKIEAAAETLTARAGLAQTLTHILATNPSSRLLPECI